MNRFPPSSRRGHLAVLSSPNHCPNSVIHEPKRVIPSAAEGPAFRFSLFAFRFSLFAFRFSLFAFRPAFVAPSLQGGIFASVPHMRLLNLVRLSNEECLRLCLTNAS